MDNSPALLERDLSGKELQRGQDISLTAFRIDNLKLQGTSSANRGTYETYPSNIKADETASSISANCELTMAARAHYA